MVIDHPTYYECSGWEWLHSTARTSGSQKEMGWLKLGKLLNQYSLANMSLAYQLLKEKGCNHLVLNTTFQLHDIDIWEHIYLIVHTVYIVSF